MRKQAEIKNRQNYKDSFYKKFQGLNFEKDPIERLEHKLEVNGQLNAFEWELLGFSKDRI